MAARFFLMIFMTLHLPFSTARADAKSRCAVSHCLCKVYKGKVSPVKLNNKIIKRSHLAYFEEDSSELSDSQASKLLQFAQSHSGSKSVSITLLGYTDGCGSEDYNETLAKERAHAVRQKIKSTVPTAKISIKVIGEKDRGHTASARRVDVIVHTKRSLTTKIEKIPADVYLIDASGSMWDGWREWTDIINASVKPGSRIYLSIMRGCTNGQTINNVSPQAGTEIWYSYWKVLDYMSPGETLLIVSDFQSNYPLTGKEWQLINQKVTQKKINVITIR